jgi:single-stranded-DNA-specific exonuclease
MYAAGLTMKLENVRRFIERFEEFVVKSITAKQQVQTIDVDAKLQLSEISQKFIRILKQFEPFGPHNMTPVFVSEDVFDSGASRIVGPNEDHIKLEVVEPTRSFQKFQGIAFSQAAKFPLIESGLPFDICYSIIENEFKGRTSVQLLVRDIKKR